MIDRKQMFSCGFPTNRIHVKIPSSGQNIVFRETTVTELKSIAKTIVDNLGRRQLDVIYDSVSEYFQSMILTPGIDVNGFTEFDRLFCLMVFFQLSFYKDPITYTCPHCGVDVNYRYDIIKYIVKLEDAYVDEQEVEIQNKNKLFKFKIGWPSVKTMSNLMTHFYSNMGSVTEEMERTQFGINFVMSFIREIAMENLSTGEIETKINLEEVDWESRMDCINLLPSLVVFD